MLDKALIPDSIQLPLIVSTPKKHTYVISHLMKLQMVNGLLK